ncbi:LPXTG cell wall anchor domain-containing protein [Demequina sp. SO4-13]|uniref:LPXTG cell wall anchor domain-containing protein n=1 Tax=Demequina sp. SO4-13 TaxID=3401027 RepID=UPI003AF65890
MRVRALLAGAATAAVLALGTATGANATYPAPEDSLQLETSVVEAGASFNVTISGPNGSDATLSITTDGADASIAGTVSLTKLIENNAANFTVTLPEGVSGEVTITAALDGEVVDSSTVTITDGDSAVGGGTTADGDSLAATGADNMGLAVAAGGLLVAGAAALAIGARRKAGSNNLQSRETVSV